jgi:DNA-binding MarR family transcriptional regulator
MPSPLQATPTVHAAFDSVIASSGRLRILTALAVEARLEFVQLRRCTRLTDGNLCTHARRLESAGFVAIEKEFRDRKPVTHVSLTARGREALERHARELLEALRPQPVTPTASPPQPPPHVVTPPSSHEDDWVD